MKSIKDTKKEKNIESIKFHVTIIGAEKDLKISDEKLTKIGEKIEADGVEEPKIVTLDIIRL